MSKEQIAPDQILTCLGEYEELYTREGRDPFLYPERKALQERIAICIRNNISNPTVASLLDNLSFEAQTTPLREGRLPHITEAIVTSREINRIAREISGELTLVSRAVIQFGSATWGAFYSAHSDSDLDLEVIVDEFDSVANLPLLKPWRSEITHALQIISDTDFDMLFYKAIIQGRTVVFHFIHPENFERFMSVDLFNPVVQRLGYRELKRNFNNFLEYTDRCSFADSKRTWSASHTNLGNGWHLVEKPIFQIEKDIFYNGIFTEWHLTPLAVTGEYENWVRSLREKLFSELVRRMVYEENGTGKEARFSNILERKHRMPEWLLDEIDQEAARIRSQINL